MQTAPEGGENKEPKAPAAPGSDGQPADPQAPAKPTAEELAAALNETDLALQKAQDEIVRLKKEGKKSGDPNANDDQIAELNKTIDGLKSDIESLKKNSVTREQADTLTTEIEAVRKKNKLLGDALVSKNTTGAGTGAGANNDQPKPPEKKAPESDADKAVLDRMKQRRIAQGRDPETGLPKK